MDNNILIAIIGVMGTVIGGLVVYFSNKKLNTAQADAVNIQTFSALVDRVQKLTDEVGIIKSSNRALWSYVYELLDFIKDKGLQPPRPPAELDTDPRLKRLFDTKPL